LKVVKELESGVTVGDLRGFCIERNCFFLLPLLSARKKDCAAGGDIDISILISLSLSLSLSLSVFSCESSLLSL
jgi:hypothetical protein